MGFSSFHFALVLRNQFLNLNLLDSRALQLLYLLNSLEFLRVRKALEVIRVFLEMLQDLL